MTSGHPQSIEEAYGIKLDLPILRFGGELFQAGWYLQRKLLAVAVHLDIAIQNGGNPPGNPSNALHDVRSIMADSFVVALYQTRAAIKALGALAPDVTDDIDDAIARFDQVVNADDLKAFRDSIQHEDERVQGLAFNKPISGHPIMVGGVFMPNALGGRNWHGWRYGTTGVGKANATRHVTIDVTPQTLAAIYEAARDAVGAIQARSPKAEGS